MNSIDIPGISLQILLCEVCFILHSILQSCNNDSLLKSVFLHQEAASDMVYGLFDRYIFS